MLSSFEHPRSCPVILGVGKVSKSLCSILQERWRQFKISTILKYFSIGDMVYPRKRKPSRKFQSCSM